jgi:hypothetical protein
MKKHAVCWLLPLCLLACDALFRPLRGNHPDNCRVNENLCKSGEVCDALLERCVTAPTADLGGCPPSCPAGQACSLQKGICETLLTFDLTSVTPRTATVGASPLVTLRGIGFEPGMTVTFKGVPASNLTVLSQDLATVQAPAMTQAGPARVEISKAGMSVGRDSLFGYAWLSIDFIADTFLPTDMQTPGAVVVADLNNDQKLDVATLHGVNASTYLSLSQGSTAKSTTYIGPFSLDGLLGSAQLNGDNALDLVYVDRGMQRALSILNSGSGMLLTAPQTLTLPASPLAGALADLNEDGLVDLAMTKASPDQLYVQPGLASGGFSATASTIIGIGPQACALASGFFNADTRRDIALLECGGQGVRVFLHMGGVNFSAPLNTPTRQGSSAPLSLAVTDFNLDGRQDIVVLNGSPGLSGHVSVLSGNGNGTFANLTMLDSIPSDFASVVMGDINGDGLPDVLLGPSSTITATSIAVLLNNNGVTLQPPQLISLPTTHRSSFHSLAVGDVTGDGKADVVYSAAASDVVLIRNQSR